MVMVRVSVRMLMTVAVAVLPMAAFAMGVLLA
jgi:hypothetical protein